MNNYALILEKKSHGYLLVNEAADMQTADGLTKLLSGQNGGPYANQWNQFMDEVESKKAAGNYTFMVKHDNGKDMINVAYQIGTDLKPVKGSLKLAAATSSSPVSGSSIDINKIAEYDPKGKMYEFIAALITISIQKFGKAWTPDHIKWVTAQTNKVKALGGSFAGIEKAANASFLLGDGNIADNWIKLTGGDLPTQVTTITSKYKKAGSVESDADIKMIMDAVDLKLNETVTSFADSAAMHGLYMLISPKFSADQLAKMWTASGKSGGFLTGIAGEIDEIMGTTQKWPEKFAAWTVGIRGLTLWSGFYTAYRFDTVTYTESIAAIKAALV
jgi:hypothetical protein